MDNKQRQDFIEKQNRAQNKGGNLNSTLPGMRQLLAKANKNGIKIARNEKSPRRRYQLLNGKK
jgi:beta-phosphoglucomutase-like phosphatase (HAD superfamily)